MFDSELESERYPEIYDIEGSRDRFSGYSLPLVTLDETGPAYIWLVPHPEYSRSAPGEWNSRGVTLSPSSPAPVLPF